MMTTEVGRHTFGSGSAAEEPEHLRAAREYQERKKSIQANLDAQLKELARNYQIERERITALYDAAFKQAAADAGLR
jgi:hypothetical protein